MTNLILSLSFCGQIVPLSAVETFEADDRQALHQHVLLDLQGDNRDYWLPISCLCLFAALLAFFISCLIPSLAFKAIKANDTTKLETWLMYWAVIGCVSVAESTVEWIVHWLPFYYEAKTLALLWLVLPQIQGSSYVYLTYLHPFLTSREDDIDKLLARGKESARAAGSEWLRLLWQKVKEVALNNGELVAQVPAGNNAATQGTAQNPPQTQRHDGAPNSLDWLSAWTPPHFIQNVALGTYNTLRPMQKPNAPAPISTRQQHPEVLRPAEPAPVSDMPSTGSHFVSSRSVSQTEVRYRHAELEQELSDMDRSPNASGTNLAQSAMDFDMVSRGEAPAKPTGLWGPNHPANEQQSTPAAQRGGWFWNRPNSFSGSSPRNKSE